MSSCPQYIKILILLLYLIVFSEVLIPHHHHSGANNPLLGQHCEKSFHYEEPQLQTYFNTMAIFTKKMLEFLALPASANSYDFSDHVTLSWELPTLLVGRYIHTPLFGFSLRAPPLCFLL